jgi:hypothetical protein
MTTGPYSQDSRAKAIDWTNMKRWIKQQIGAYLSLYDVIFSILCKAAIQLLLLYFCSNHAVANNLCSDFSVSFYA